MADFTHNELIMPISGPDVNGRYQSVSVPGAKANIEKIPGMETRILEVERKANNPSLYTSYLAPGADYTTPALVADTFTKLLIPTTIKFATDWEVAEVNAGQFAIRYTGAATRKFSINTSSGMQSGSNNTIVKLRMYKGVTGDLGASTHELGVGVPRKVGTGTDTGALAMCGVFDIVSNGYIEVYASSSVAGTITFIETSINIVEVN